MSNVDITITDPKNKSKQVEGWRVLNEESLSDHRYILFRISENEKPNSERFEKGKPEDELLISRQEINGPYKYRKKAWSIYKLSEDLAKTYAIFQEWKTNTNRRTISETTEERETLKNKEKKDRKKIVEDISTEIDEIMEKTSNFSMPKRTNLEKNRRKNKIWWDKDLYEMRKRCVTEKRNLLRMRRKIKRKKKEKCAEEERARVQIKKHIDLYNSTKREFRKRIRKNKTEAWRKIIKDLENDPWGIAYKLINNRLNNIGVKPVITQMSESFRGAVIDGLFPKDESIEYQRILVEESSLTEEEVPRITEEELNIAFKAITKKNNAPGPKGVHNKILSITYPFLKDQWRKTFDTCMTARCFPEAWKRAKLTLLQKPGKDPEKHNAYRPISLLDGSGKILEKLITNRIDAEISAKGTDISNQQFGFKKKTSTIDALIHLRELVEAMREEDQHVIIVSLDIRNAFNSVKIKNVIKAMETKKVSGYLIDIVRDYFINRGVTYETTDAREEYRATTRGVPQGSVMAAKLWNIAYDGIIRHKTSHNVYKIGYADDTLLIAHGKSFTETKRTAREATIETIYKIKSLGLQVATEKTETMYIPKKTQKKARTKEIYKDTGLNSMMISGEKITLKEDIRYLGIQIDYGLTMHTHFEKTKLRVQQVLTNIVRIMPNIDGPSEQKRKMYANIIYAIVLYGAPFYGVLIEGDKKIKRTMNEIDRTVAIKRICGYRTIGRENAIMLATCIPLADKVKEAVEYYQEVKKINETAKERPITDEQITKLKNTVKKRIRDEIIKEIVNRRHGNTSRRNLMIGSILKYKYKWYNRSHGNLNYYLTQILSVFR